MGGGLVRDKKVDPLPALRAGLPLSGGGEVRPTQGDATMNFDDTPQEAAFRAEARAWVDANAPREFEAELVEGFARADQAAKA